MDNEKLILKQLGEIHQLCILNFVELQDIRRRLSLEPVGSGAEYEYRNSLPEYLKQLDNKMHSLLKDFPHLDES